MDVLRPGPEWAWVLSVLKGGVRVQSDTQAGHDAFLVLSAQGRSHYAALPFCQGVQFLGLAPSLSHPTHTGISVVLHVNRRICSDSLQVNFESWSQTPIGQRPSCTPYPILKSYNSHSHKHRILPESPKDHPLSPVACLFHGESLHIPRVRCQSVTLFGCVSLRTCDTLRRKWSIVQSGYLGSCQLSRSAPKQVGSMKLSLQKNALLVHVGK